MRDRSEWIGTRWRARCNMRLPKGPVGIGDEFVFDKRCAELGLQPEAWIRIGNAEQIAEPRGLAETIEDKPAPARRGRRSSTLTVKPAKTEADDGDS